jgi:hypothetical protein
LRSPKTPKKPKLILDFVAQAKAFHSMSLLERVEPKEAPTVPEQDVKDYNQLLQRMGFNR